jgi:3-hydroxyacyl-CoA dehydrogenase
VCVSSHSRPLHNIGGVDRPPQGIGSAKDIDNVMKLGTNVPMGPLELADFIGG